MRTSVKWWMGICVTTVDEVYILGVALASGSEGVTCMSIESMVMSWKLHDPIYTKCNKFCEYLVDWKGIVPWDEMCSVGQ